MFSPASTIYMFYTPAEDHGQTLPPKKSGTQPAEVIEIIPHPTVSLKKEPGTPLETKESITPYFAAASRLGKAPPSTFEYNTTKVVDS